MPLKNPPLAIVHTTPETYFDDVARLFRLAKFDEIMDPKRRTVIKLNISWQEYFPSCSTQPYQLDGMLRELSKRNFKDVLALENMTVVTDARAGMIKNRFLPLLEKFDIPHTILVDEEWEEVHPSRPMVFGQEDMLMPKPILGAQIIHLPTFKCHGHSTITCSMKNAFGFLRTVRHHYHLRIHEILVDLLRIQKEFCGPLFGFADSTIAMNGAGPRTGVPYVQNYIAASADLVALDALCAKMIGYDPMSIGHVRLAHEQGLGNADLDSVDIVGDCVDGVCYGYKTKLDPVIRFDRLFRSSLLEPLMMRSAFFKVNVKISHYMRDIWLKTRGKRHIARIMKSGWGKLFRRYL
ncbi:MAG: DUF362 domain-containing protein [Promethearchaeota archaeon]